MSADPDDPPMDPIRFGRGIRALRHRRAWRQIDLARRAGVSRSAIARIELGQGDRATVATLDRIAGALDARVVVRLDWRGEHLDRLLDHAHSALVDEVVRILRANGWTCVTEATFNHFGERGSIDVFAFHEGSRIVLVIEVKSVVPDVGPMLMSIDRKARLALALAAERGWQATAVGRILVVPEGSGTRRRIDAARTTFANAFPQRNVEIRRWIANPTAAISGLWFLSSAGRVGAWRGSVRRPT